MPAHMIPPVPKEFDEKSDEGLVFKALKKLPEDYYVFHSVSIAVVENNTFYEREIDFVVAHPKKGILCIEAKNGSGIWYDKTSRCWKYQNGTVMQHDGPYHQISTAKRAIISKIKCHANEDVQNLCSYYSSICATAHSFCSLLFTEDFVIGSEHIFPNASSDSSGFSSLSCASS